jgi:curli production assembly/transport component CsgG
MVLVAACGSYMHQPIKPRRAMVGPETPARKLLLNLPEAQEKIVVAVYKFRDQTGQYKPSETGANWSTAVTQGATTILIRALEESGWFIPIERENMANLLNERKIIRTSRAQYEGREEENSLLPPLLFAGVILEGGIISYESNILTGGAGVRYFGADASSRYREDRVSIYIRAVSSANGKVLKTVYTTKSVLSQEVSVGLFRYVKAKRLLEAETGFTYNEPAEMCVSEAIEKAVESLIIEGVEDKLWALRNPQDTASAAFMNYHLERQTNYDVNELGRILNKSNRGRLMLGAKIGTNTLWGDSVSSELRPKASLVLGLELNDHLYLDLEGGYRGLMIQRKADTYAYFCDLSLRYIFLPYDKFTPYVCIGGGYEYQSPAIGLSGKKFLPKANGVFGLEYMLSGNLGLSVSSVWNYYLSDRIDALSNGRYNDFSWGITLGIKAYL